jgi:hypothetical protein
MATNRRKQQARQRGAKERAARRARRERAAELFAQGRLQAEVARKLDVCRQSAGRWHTCWQADGRERPTRLDPALLRQRGREFTQAGEVFYWPGGHTGWTEEDITFLKFSPPTRASPSSNTSRRSWPAEAAQATVTPPTAQRNQTASSTARTPW